VPIGALDPARAATYACAGITAFGAMRKLDAMVEADDWVAVIGCGGVGMTALALYATMSKARIVAIDPDPAKREAALAYGAALAFDPGAPDARGPSSRPAAATSPARSTSSAAKPARRSR
jgi:propanol-preferring alcohol dehydrogenase